MKKRMKLYFGLLFLCLAVTACAKEEKEPVQVQTEEEELLSQENAEMSVPQIQTAGARITEEQDKQEQTTQAQTTEIQTTEEVSSLPETAAPVVEKITTYVAKIKNPSEYVIAIDAGHQAQGNFEKEPIGPGASETKNKVAGGTRGVVTGMPEYELTLQVSLKLRDILSGMGYQVVMVRESNDVDISNAERAGIANQAKADVFVRIHADAAEVSAANGITVLCQTSDNPYNGGVYAYSRSLSECILDAMTEETGARRRGITETDSMSGINWAQVPVAIVEMGFMTNPEEDELMGTEEYQNKLAVGMAKGIENYLLGLK